MGKIWSESRNWGSSPLAPSILTSMLLAKMKKVTSTLADGYYHQVCVCVCVCVCLCACVRGWGGGGTITSYCRSLILQKKITPV